MFGLLTKFKVLGIVAMTAAVLLPAALVRADEPVKTDTALSWIPDNAAFYCSALRCREQIDLVRHSKAWERLKNLPAVVEALKEMDKQSEDPESPAAKFQSGLKNPQVANALNFLADLFGQETFVYGDPNFVKLLELSQLLNTAQYQMALGAAQGKEPEELQHLQTAATIHLLAQNPGLMVVPNTIAGFKVTDKQQARQNLDVAAGFLALGAAFVPELNGHFERKKIGEHDFVLLSLDGKMIPWDQVPLDEVREHEIEKGETDKVIEKVKDLKLILAMGLRDDYLLLAVVESTDVLAQLGSGRSLATRSEFRPLAPHAGKKLTGISYLSQDLAARMATSAKDLDTARGYLDQLTAQLKLPAEEQEQIRKDAASLAEDLKPMLPKPGAKMGFSYLTDSGYESFGYDWAAYPQLDASKPLSLTAHVGGDPLFAFVQRDKGAAEAYNFLAKLFGMGRRYFDKYAVPTMNDEDKEKYQKFAKGAEPLVKRFDAATRKLWIPAVADGQGALVFDAKLTSQQPSRQMPKMKQAVPLPEPALVFAVSDAKRLVEAGREYREVFNGLAALLHESDPGSIPSFSIPVPEEKNVDGGTLYYYPVPDECGIDKQIAITIGVSESVAALAGSHAHAERLLASKPLQAGGVLTDAARPRANALVLRWAALVDAATPWVDEGIRQAQQQAAQASAEAESAAKAADAPKTDDSGDKPAKKAGKKGKGKDKVKKGKDDKKPAEGKSDAKTEEVLRQVHTVLDVLKGLRTVTLETYQESDVLVSHAVTEIHDVE